MATTDDVRRRVLDASVALVAEHGVRAVSFREVARRAGVSHQAPYHHFGNHHGILRAIAQEGFASLTAAMADAAAAAAEPRAGLVAAGLAYVAFARDHVGHFRVMFQDAATTDRADTPLPEAEGTYKTLVTLATAAHRAGSGANLSIDALSHLAWSTVHGLAFLLIEGMMRDKRGTSDEAIARQVVTALGALLAPSRAAERRGRAPRRATRP
ncbi:MAG: TetR/AcrR family transcriptional regulator [Kofleriaceae bacterium]|nr:TetR/AcrR family transcriptional regulator [Kofleriaceae bacterium]